MKQGAYSYIVKKILQENKYLTLATQIRGKPWATPLFFTQDQDHNLYVISKRTARHTNHIRKSPQVAFAIFDSHQKEGMGNGIQAEGTIYELLEKELEEAFGWYRTTFLPMEKESFIGSAQYRMFKIIPTHWYIQDPEATTDKRIEVVLEKS